LVASPSVPVTPSVSVAPSVPVAQPAATLTLAAPQNSTPAANEAVGGVARLNQDPPRYGTRPVSSLR
jgi:hypothetical protein